MKSLSETVFGRALGLLSDAVCRHRWLFLFPQVLLFGLGVIYTVFHLQFDPNRDDLVGADKLYHRNFLEFKKEFPAQDDLVVLAQSEDLEKNRQFVERLGARLEVETNLFTDVFYRKDFKMLGPKALLLAPEEDLRELSRALSEYMPFIARFTHATNLDSLFALVNSQILHAKRETNAENDSLIKALPTLARIVRQATASLERPGVPPSPGLGMLFNPGGDDEEHIAFAHGRIYLVTAHARTQNLNGPAVERLRQIVARTELEVPGVNVGLTGEPVLEHDEMAQSQKDSTVASVVSLVVCSLIFIYGYQETGRPLKATFCLIIGLGYTLAFTTAVVGHLNILTITFLPILIGLAIDFGVHLITRYEEELRLGRSEEAAMRKAIVFTGQGVFTGALTTAAAFLAMCLTNFKGIQEMGVICGGGMLVCLAPMMTLLPVLLFRGRQNTLDLQKAPKVELRSKIENLWLGRPLAVTAVTLVLSLLAVSQFHKIYFDYDLLHMQSRGLPAVVFEQKLIDSTPKSVLFGAVVADSAEQAVELQRRLQLLPAVSTNDSMAGYLTEDQSGKLKLIGQIKKQIASMRFEPADPRPAQIEQLSRTLYSSYGYFGQVADNLKTEASSGAASKGKPDRSEPPPTDNPSLAKQVLELRDAIGELRKIMLGMDADLAAKQLTAFQQALFNDVEQTFRSLREQDDRARMQVGDLPPSLRNRFVGVTGKFLIMVSPKKDIWQRDQQEEFVKELRTVDPKVTGTPVQLYEYTTLLKDSYVEAAWYALAAIAIMVFIHFRSLSSVVLALLPVGIGSIWMAGLMGACHIPFNPANIMTLPLVIGIGVTNGIHILNRFAEERKPGILAKSTGKAVFISGLTTISGFGSLILAQHQGIRSLGEVMSIGVATCMIAGLTFLPAVLNLLSPWRGTAPRPASDEIVRPALDRQESK